MEIISVRQESANVAEIIAYFQTQWATPETMALYADSISHARSTSSSLPQWYLLKDGATIVGGVALITNDFISRMDLWPWLAALQIEEAYRGKGYARLLIEHVKEEARALGFEQLYLSTDHQELYEELGFTFIGMGYHPWGESSRIYQTTLNAN